MSKNIDKDFLIELPSGLAVHPCRLIHRDGTLMWKHALMYKQKFWHVPETQAQEAHIVKTAYRLEELNTWVSQNLEPWECLEPVTWYAPNLDKFKEGISCLFKHTIHDNETVYDCLKDHIQDQEELELRSRNLFFKRC